MFLTGFSIGKRLTLVLGAILALSLISSLYAIVKLRSLGSELDTMVGDNLKVERAATDWLRHTTSGVQRASAIAKSSDTALIEYFAPFTAAAVKETNELQKMIETHIDTPAERALFDKVGELRKTYLATRDEIGKLKKAGDAEAAGKLFSERFEPTARDYTGSVQQMVELQRKQFDDAAQRILDMRAQTSNLLIIVSVLSVLLGSFLAWRLTRSITQPLADAEIAAQAIAELNLTGAASQHQGNDETGRLLRAIDTMRDALQVSLHEVRGVVDSISTASAQIAVGNHDLSARTEQTASSLQETASSMEELTSTVRNSADSAGQANKLASAAAEVAQRGGRVIAQVVKTMDDINTSSKRISDIIGVIDGIAFQTNILALNAAVEAARAGEQGRGFAVVASEVRSLAGRSAEAAKEIKRLISESVEKVESGATLVKDAGGTMDEIVGSVQRVSDIISEISQAATEQSQGIGQVNVAVSQLDQMTQQNAALVEESAAAASSLQDQAKRLAGAIAAFRLKG
ncbi:methyl-accepting chemotaxis protein [Roseateles toxinivorans]|uniref:Methyl-accepting chemotaxis protein n=1 Tax=Roseateles toxinivorans TaxID=270368 RepID=A0A4V3CT84_9BURK|nr:methyl-accepting chemotaxis protein [Roseateles toxinivorans]TDP63724.1 methyl-accepting chemotaxis protein [Roseateles toxinivorans]